MLQDACNAEMPASSITCTPRHIIMLSVIAKYYTISTIPSQDYKEMKFFEGSCHNLISASASALPEAHIAHDLQHRNDTRNRKRAL